MTAAVLREPPNTPPRAGSANYDLLLEVLVSAAANGSLVNLNTLTDTCHGNGYPLVIAVRIQAQ